MLAPRLCSKRPASQLCSAAKLKHAAAVARDLLAACRELRIANCAHADALCHALSDLVVDRQIDTLGDLK